MRVTDAQLEAATVILRLIAYESKPPVTLSPEIAKAALSAVLELRARRLVEKKVRK